MHSTKLITSAALIMVTGLNAAHAGTVTYFHLDPGGNGVLQTNAAGSVVKTLEYRPYGKSELDQAGRGPGFAGHVNEPLSGLTYMRARFYDPASGRFIGTDPVRPKAGDGFGFNRYAYANNNPLKFIDPDGRQVVSLNERDNKAIASMINQLASKVFAFNQNNQLQSVGGGKGTGSSYYTSQLEKAIGSKNITYIRLADTTYDSDMMQDVSIMNYGGAATVSFGDGSAHLVTIGKEFTTVSAQGGGVLDANASGALMHELVGHAIPRMIGTDTGNAVSNENKVRAQVPPAYLREPEPFHKE